MHGCRGFVAWALLVRAASAATGRPPDVLLYDGSAIDPPLVVADLDGDGARELAWHAGGLAWIAADPTALSAAPSGPGVPVLALDYDGDGVDNLIVVLDGGAGPELYDPALGEPLGLRWYGAAAAADVDGDGYDDLVDPTGTLYGSPSGFTPGPALEGLPAEDFVRAFSVGDLDADGREDVAVCVIAERSRYEWNSTALLRLQLGADLGPEGWPARWSWEGPDRDMRYVAGEQLTVADTDGNGVDELVVLSRQAGWYTRTVSLLGADGPRLLASHESFSGTTPSLHNLGDLDGDGDDEMLFTTIDLAIVDAEPADGEVLDRLAPALEVPVPGDEDLVPLVDVDLLSSAVEDFDGDGAMDIAAAYAWDRGVSRVAIWFGTSLVAAPPAPWGRPDPAPDPPGAPPRTCGCASTSGGVAGWALAAAVLALGRRRPAGPTRPGRHRPLTSR